MFYRFAISKKRALIGQISAFLTADETVIGSPGGWGVHWPGP
jgi:hypothetical protein